MNIFEIATRNKIRFSFKGIIATEDLWDLSLVSLDSIYKTLNAKSKQAKEESLLNTKSKDDEMLETQIEIIKHIVETKQAEIKAKLEASENRQKKQRISAILKDKQDDALLNKSEEELTAMLKELN